ncbi:MAG: hypothetical protein ACPGXK_01270 [Phycisphaerae bacterium]
MSNNVNHPSPPKSLWLVMGFIFLTAAWATYDGVQPARVPQQLREIINASDRILVTYPLWSPDYGPRPQIQIDASKATEFVNKLAFGGQVVSCRCWGEYCLEFSSGEEILARVGVAHQSTLKWHNGTLWGDVLLTDASARAIHLWLAEFAPVLDQQITKMITWPVP